MSKRADRMRQAAALRRVKLLRRSAPCKIGTVPHSVILRHRYGITPGAEMLVREPVTGSRYFRVRVVAVNDDGYFFAERI